jgi:hypothetical protein
MRDLGYVCEDEIEIASGTSPRSRARWTAPKGVMFGTVKWYPLKAIKRTLDARVDAIEESDEPPRRAFL